MDSKPKRSLPWCRKILLIGLSLLAPVANSQEQPSEARTGILRLLPADIETRHSLNLPGQSLDYRAKAGTLPLRDARGEITAEIFFVSYMLEPRTPDRPVTFVFNGGPGAASAFLHLGAIGPRRTVFATSGEVLPPPARFADNPDTWLDLTDLVFVDPVGTGYSRTPDPEQASQFWGVDQDVDAMAAFIRLYLAVNERVGSPVFLVGESYGGFRAAILAHELQSESGIAPRGVVLISPALEFALLRGAEDYQPLSWALTLPAFAAVKLEWEGVQGDESLTARLAEVERFALSDYIVDLANGIEAEADTVQALSQYTGLAPEIVRQQNGRLSTSLFIKEFARDEGRVLSRYDGSVAGPDPAPQDPQPSAPDAVLDRVVPAFTTSFIQYLRQDLGYETEITFRLLNSEISGRWDYGTTPQRQGYAGALTDLQQARALNPLMQVMIAHGYTDLVTPYFASKYLIDQLAPLAGAMPIDLRLYEGGHMMYMRPASRQKLREDAAALYKRASRASEAVTSSLNEPQIDHSSRKACLN